MEERAKRRGQSAPQLAQAAPSDAEAAGLLKDEVALLQLQHCTTALLHY